MTCGIFMKTVILMNGMKNERNRIEEGTLYLTATPIGNLSDLSERAVKVLSEVDFIAAEDTRVTLKLLNYLGISKSVVSYFEHNKRERGEEILKRLQAGESCALVTDAGTPAVSDPGADLVRLCADNGVAVTSIPGACAAVTALTLSGLDTEHFMFEGFLKGAKKERASRLEKLKTYDCTLILYEAPHHLRDTLKDLREALGNRRIALCRELTKLNEEVMRTELDSAAAYYDAHEPRGEYVLIIEGSVKPDDAFWKDMNIREHVEYYINTLGFVKSEALKAAARDRGVAKNVIYKEFLR